MHAARLRLSALVDPAIGELARLLSRSKKDRAPDSVRLGAAKDILDRVGLKAPPETPTGQEPVDVQLTRQSLPGTVEDIARPGTRAVEE